MKIQENPYPYGQFLPKEPPFSSKSKKLVQLNCFSVLVHPTPKSTESQVTPNHGGCHELPLPVPVSLLMLEEPQSISIHSLLFVIIWFFCFLDFKWILQWPSDYKSSGFCQSFQFHPNKKPSSISSPPF